MSPPSHRIPTRMMSIDVRVTVQCDQTWCWRCNICEIPEERRKKGWDNIYCTYIKTSCSAANRRMAKDTVLPALLLDGGGGVGLGVTLALVAVAPLTVIPVIVGTFVVMALWIAVLKAVLLVNAAAVV